MAFPIKICSICEEEFELKPDKPGFADRCPECSTSEKTASTAQHRMDADERKSLNEAMKLGGRRCATFCTARIANWVVRVWGRAQVETAALGCLVERRALDVGGFPDCVSADPN